MTSIRTPGARHRVMFAYELSISAVPYEAALVSDLIAEMAARLQSAPVWEGHTAAPPPDVGPTLATGRSRVDEAHGRAYSTANLVADWVASSVITPRA